jgi:hypothetical protein
VKPQVQILVLPGGKKKRERDEYFVSSLGPSSVVWASDSSMLFPQHLVHFFSIYFLAFHLSASLQDSVMGVQCASGSGSTLRAALCSVVIILKSFNFFFFCSPGDQGLVYPWQLLFLLSLKKKKKEQGCPMFSFYAEMLSLFFRL